MKNDETEKKKQWKWWKREKTTKNRETPMKNDEKEKKTMKNDEKERKNAKKEWKKQWNMM